jgi:thiosulfate/3-mercaptopyruvate sulfurtransferase
MDLDPLLAPEHLSALLPQVVLLDARTGPRARERYAEAHLRGALFADLDADLAAKVGDPAHGGRHPLPEASAFAARVGRWGIARSSHVVIYDDQGGANAAARAWWMLRALGHARVQVLDGGLHAARAAGLPITDAPSAAADAGPYPARGWQWPIADADDVERARRAPRACVLDVRAPARFAGEHEPIDPIAGHIPGAHNLPLAENLMADGRFKSAATLRQQYQALLQGRSPNQLIVHCGSGVTACHTLLALERAGLYGAALYVGSWSEWCRNPERPRAP